MTKWFVVFCGKYADNRRRKSHINGTDETSRNKAYSIKAKAEALEAKASA